MEIQTVPIDSIHADPANVRRHGERNMAAIKASLARFGQQHPIIVDSKGIVRAGNGRLQAAIELGWTEIAIVRTDLVGVDATAFSLADNRSSELATWDETGLAEQLRALQSEDFDLAAVGYDAGEVDRLIEGLAGELVDDPQAEWQGMPEFQHEDLESKFKAHVHFRNEEDLAAFEEIIGQKIPRDRWAIWHPKAERESYADKQYEAG